MNKEEYVANMRAMVKKYVERAEDSVTNPPTKRVPFPRAKRGDLVAVKFQDCTRQLTVDLAFFMNTWGYKGTDPEVERQFSDEDILLNISTGIDYQEKEDMAKCASCGSEVKGYPIQGKWFQVSKGDGHDE